MAQDSVGNTIKEEEHLLYNGMVMQVKKIIEPHIIGGQPVGQGKIQGMQMPGQLICMIAITYDPNKAINCHVIKTPQQDSGAQA